MAARPVRLVVLGIGVTALVAWPLAKGVSKLASTFQSRAAVASIDSPAPSSGVGREVVVRGHVDPDTIRGALLLVAAEAGEKWELAQEIDTHESAWRAKVTLACGKGTTHRLAVVRVDLPLDDRLREALAPRIPDWLRSNSADGSRPIHRHRRENAPSYPELPAGATQVAAVDVFVAEANNDRP